jgi:SAM-dependent methyltransferase
MDLKAELEQCYRETSKHSQYQSIHPDVLPFIDGKGLEVRSKWEMERMAAILESIPLQGARVLDIGANTGFFSFAALHAGCLSVDAVEGCAAHARFIQLAAQITGKSPLLHVENRYYDFDGEPADTAYDVAFLLNVLHHFGDDYGQTSASRESAKTHMCHALRLMAKRTRCLAFQMGFNWKGNRTLPLFAAGTKTEMINFVKSSVEGCWDLEKVWIARRNEGDGTVFYEPLNASNAPREDALGEFLNRPLFILRSRRM